MALGLVQVRRADAATVQRPFAGLLGVEPSQIQRDLARPVWRWHSGRVSGSSTSDPGAGGLTARGARLEKRELARQSLIDAAYELLEGRPWPELTVDDFTRSAGLSRTAFYQHFVDREDLLLALFTNVADTIAAVGNPWMTNGADPIAEHRFALRGLVELYITHGRVMQAVADAATSAPDIARAYEQLVGVLLSTTADAIRRDNANGHGTIENPDEISRALTAMMERYLQRSFGKRPFTDVDTAVDTLATVITRTLYLAP